MPTWPASLPQNVQQGGFELGLPDGSVRTEMDAGPSFARQRFTAAPTPFSARIWVDRTQYATLVTFWETDTAHGTLAFDWQHPITESAASVRFMSQPRITALSGNLFAVALEFEVLP